jgi:hypothetical protein
MNKAIINTFINKVNNELINNSFMINDSIEKFRQELFQLNVEKYQKQ